jgi:hypothetical protein
LVAQVVHGFLDVGRERGIDREQQLARAITRIQLAASFSTEFQCRAIASSTDSYYRTGGIEAEALGTIRIHQLRHRRRRQPCQQRFDGAIVSAHLYRGLDRPVRSLACNLDWRRPGNTHFNRVHFVTFEVKDSFVAKGERVLGERGFLERGHE